MNPLNLLPQLGQSIWLDYIDRHFLSSGGLARLVAEDDLRGVTSNPAIFEKAIAGTADYRADLETLAGSRLAPLETLERLVLPDIRTAADQLRKVYDITDGLDGYVSLEVSPALAYDTAGTLREARRLWQAVERDNLMIKVPATEAGLPAVAELIAEGINVNVTLLFSRAMYARVADAYLAGLERRVAAGLPVAPIASVASFFISRIDAEVDERLGVRATTAGESSERAFIDSLKGQVAIANAKLAFRTYSQAFSSPRWRALAAHGVRPQRLLWASTGVKNPHYRDVRYIEELIGPDTVNTVPPATLDAFRDHGQVRCSLNEGLDEATAILESVEHLGISLDEVTDRLLEAGVALFVQAHDALLRSLAR